MCVRMHAHTHAPLLRASQDSLVLEASSEQQNDIQKVFSRMYILVCRYVLDKTVKTVSEHNSLLKFGKQFITEFCASLKGSDPRPCQTCSQV